MSPKYTDRQLLEMIYENAIDLRRVIAEKDLTRQVIMSDRFYQWATALPLLQIGEYVDRLSDEYKEEHNEVDWIAIENLRHRLVHDYVGIKWNMIAEIVFDDLPELIEQLERLRQEE